MAKITDDLLPKVHGKMNKKAAEIHRVRNGKEHVYTIEDEYDGPPSKAQTAHRSLFGKVNAVVNVLLADPAQTALWTERYEQYRRDFKWSVDNQTPYQTLRQFVFAAVREQLQKQAASKRRKKAAPIVLPRGIKRRTQYFSDLSASEIYEILKARFIVFYGEQNCRYLDMDNIDYTAFHITLSKRGQVLSYARLFKGTEPGVWHLGRMLTIPAERGKGFARYVLSMAVAEADSQGATSLLIHAQVQAVPFYEALGFVAFGDVFSEAEIPHICMRLDKNTPFWQKMM